MPRQSAASFSVTTITGVPARLSPPADLNETERALFIDIVADCKPMHFRPSESVLLCAYVRTILTEREASTRLAAEGRVIDGKPSPWINICSQANKSMLAFARALRLSPLARGPNNPSRSERPEPVLSYYERVALERRSETD